MNVKGFKRMLLGEKMPDRNDPEYRERYEREVEAGRKFARRLRIDKAAASVQSFAERRRTVFFSLIFAFVAFTFCWNIYRISVVVKAKPSSQTAVERQDSLLKERRRAAVMTLGAEGATAPSAPASGTGEITEQSNIHNNGN